MLVTYPSGEIENIWSQIEPLIRKVLKKHEKDYNILSIKDMLLKKEVQLWASYNGQLEAIVLTHIVIYPNHKICEIFLCAGSRLKNWQLYMANIEDWAKSMGCKSIRFQGRPGWKRKFPDFKQIKIIMEKEIWADPVNHQQHKQQRVNHQLI